MSGAGDDVQAYLQQQPAGATATSVGAGKILIQQPTTSQHSMPITVVSSGGEGMNFVQAAPVLEPQASSSAAATTSHHHANYFDTQSNIQNFWQKQKQNVENLTTLQLRDAHRNQELPLARIKKIMKLDEDVKGQMISAEAPVLFAKASEMFIEELTLRAWLHTEDNKRKTLQKNDIAMAISKYEQFDFLIDIVPRDESSKSHHRSGGKMADSLGGALSLENLVGAQQVQMISGPGDGQQYFIQMPGGNNQAPSQSSLPPSLQLPNGQIVQATQIGTPIPLSAGPGQTIQLVTLGEGGAPGQPIQLQLMSQGDGDGEEEMDE